MSPSRPDGGLRLFDPLSPRKEAHPSLGSGPYVCKAGESKDGLSSEWTFLQSYSFRRWCASLPRTVLSSRTAFSAFLLRTFHISRSDSQAPAKLLFPLPVPKCGIFEALPPRCSSRHRRRVDFDRAFHVLIMALNFLHDDFHFVDLAKLSFVPNPAQKVALSNLRGLLKAFGNCAGEIHVPASGRRSTALVAMLADLSEFFTTRGLSGDAYEIGFNGADNLPPGEVQVDTTRAEELLPYRSLDPSRLKLTGCANWDPSSYLDDSLWLPFVEPSVLLWTSLFDESDLPNLDKEDPQKVLELAKIWDARGLLHLSTTQVPEEMKPACLRVFNCYKGPLQDRQIGDKRGRNQIEAYLPGPSRSLPCGHQLTVLEVNPLCEKVAVCMSDHKDFYHQLQVTQARAESNVLWPPLSTAALVHTQAYKDLVSRIEKSKKRGPREAVGDFLGGRPIPSGGSKIPEKVHACFNSVIQGDHLGVEIATQSHSNLLKRNGLLCGEEELTSTRPFRGSGCLQGLVIDDFFSVSIEKDVPAKQNGRQSAARKRFEVAKNVYESEGLIGSSEKDVVDQQVAKVAGAEIDSSDFTRKLGITTVAAPASKRLALSFLSLRLASRRATTDALHACLIGGWTSCLMYRRPLMAILDRVHRFTDMSQVDQAHPRILDLTRSVSQELVILSVLAPLISSDISATLLTEVFATDSSDLKGAIASTETVIDTARALHRTGRKKGGYCRMLSREKALLSQIDADWEPEVEDGRVGPSKPIALRFHFVEVCGGTGKIAKFAAEEGLTVGPVIDIDRSPAFDLCLLRIFS